MRMNFEIEIFSHNLAFIKVKGKKRGFVGKVPTNAPGKEWSGLLEGNKSELRVVGAELHDLKFDKAIFKYKDHKKAPPITLQIDC